jgi:exopolyphosphatase / guanosine-5'-triphosphate,3'-diphosphate pyrophosphatase
MKYAVVDLGTNSARLMIARIAGNQAVSEYKTLRMIRLGENMVEKKEITGAAMKRTMETLLEFENISKRRGADGKLFCFATSAVREAENKEGFLKYIKRECGIDIEVISGEMEATLGFAGSVKGQGGMFDIGGGSTEVMFGELGNIEYMHSFKIGTVRFLQMFPGADDAEPESYEKAHILAERTFREIPDTGNIVFTGIGGSATALAAIDLELNEYMPERVQGHVITYERAKEICGMIESRTKKQREKITGLEDKRADVIVFGAIIMLEFMKKISADNIIVSDRDNQESYLEMKLGIL